MEDKYVRVANYHHGTLESVAEIMSASGIENFQKSKDILFGDALALMKLKIMKSYFPTLKF